MISPPTGLTEWQIFWQDGQTYSKLCASKVKYFTNEIRYNIAGMAIEKLVMGFLMRRNQLPEGHTLRDLMDALEKETTLPQHLGHGIRLMDNFQQICAFDTYTRTVPNDHEMANMVEQVSALNSHLTLELE
ncbi:hypothetical protein P3T73_10285 [Kiritimatiellota bacterium B12222]|nr:hypothetical protein P3T73_10285 [Kiritimatiellota bacterium B12222]